MLSGSCRNAQSREPSRDSSVILFVTRAESPSQSRLLHADHEKVKVDQQHQASDEVRFAQRGVQQARTKEERDSREIDRMPDEPIGPIGNQGIAPPAGLILSSSEACVAPEMEGQTRRHEANAQPAGEVRANSRKARSVRLLQKGQNGSRSQPH